jgi:hypothetical protein
MHLSESHEAGRLPKRFPVGTTYVVEGRGGEEGHLRVFSRYVVLPGGQRINLAADFGGPAAARYRVQSRYGSERQTQKGGKSRSARAKKNMAAGGTTRRHGR